MAKGRITANLGECQYSVEMFVDVGGKTEPRSVTAYAMEYKPNLRVGSSVSLVQSAYNAASTDVVIGAGGDEMIAEADALTPRRWLYHELMLPTIMRGRPRFWFGRIVGITGNLARVACEHHGMRYPIIWPKGERVHECDALYMGAPGFEPFEVGDRVVVSFHFGKGTPTVIGFAQKPRLEIENEGSVRIQATRDTIHLFYGYGGASTVLGLGDSGHPQTIQGWLYDNKKGRPKTTPKPFAQKFQRFLNGQTSSDGLSQLVSKSGLSGLWFSDTYGLYGPPKGLVLVRDYDIPADATDFTQVKVQGLESISVGKLLFMFKDDPEFGAKQPSVGRLYKRSDFIAEEYPGKTPSSEADKARYLYKITGFEYVRDSSGNIIQAEMTAEMIKYPDAYPVEELPEL